MPLTEAAAVNVVPVIHFTLSGLECPITKAELKFMAQKTKTTGSTSTDSAGKVWDDYGAGAKGWSLSFEGVWRTGANITPPDLTAGATYAATLQTITGHGYAGNLLVDDVTLDFDPTAGVFTWKGSGTGNGPLNYN